MATTTRPARVVRQEHLDGGRGRAVGEKTSSDGPSPASSPCTRSALPLAISWFVTPALVLILSRALGWPH